MCERPHSSCRPPALPHALHGLQRRAASPRCGDLRNTTTPAAAKVYTVSPSTTLPGSSWRSAPETLHLALGSRAPNNHFSEKESWSCQCVAALAHCTLHALSAPRACVVNFALTLIMCEKCSTSVTTIEAGAPQGTPFFRLARSSFSLCHLGRSCTASRRHTTRPTAASSSAPAALPAMARMALVGRDLLLGVQVSWVLLWLQLGA